MLISFVSSNVEIHRIQMIKKIKTMCTMNLFKNILACIFCIVNQKDKKDTFLKLRGLL